MNKLLKNISYSAIILVLFFLICPLVVFAADADKMKLDLENQIRQKQEEINQHQEKIQETQGKAKTLNNEISILEGQINKIRLEINQVDLTIQKSTLNIQEIDEQIDILEQSIDEKKELLAEYIRIFARYDQETLLEVILKNEKFSDFFEEIKALETIQEEIHSVLGAIGQIKETLVEDKEKIEIEREEQNMLKSIQLGQSRSVENMQNKKENILSKTKGEEKLYQQMIKDNQEEIVFIREQLILLEKYNITEAEMVRSAIFAGAKTGIRPAYLLGVLENESWLGRNVGTGNWKEDMYQCYLNKGSTNTARKMRDAFLLICKELGLNPDLQVVSARPTAYSGCGGAMGIAQFMPTTWLAYKDRIAAMTGNNPPNPWLPVDAFTASAIKLADAGASSQTYEAERNAYAKYIAGKWWYLTRYLNIADRAMSYAAGFQKEYFN